MGYRIGIVGAGPSGIMAALEAAEAGAQVLLFDTNATVGRKLLVAGNGRCNLSNQHASAQAYDCADPSFLERALSQFGPTEALHRLLDLGVPTYATPDGWCYPISNSGAAVVQALDTALRLSGVRLRLKTWIRDIIPSPRRGAPFVLVAGGGDHTYTVDRVIVATGGKAYPALGAKGTMFPVLERLGHTILPVRPALAPILTDVRQIHKLQGVRLDVRLELWAGERLLAESIGNLMFARDGVSGPAPMNLSYLVSKHPGADLWLGIDLLSLNGHHLKRFVERMRHRPVPLTTVLGTILPPKMGPVLLKLAGLDKDARLSEVSDEQLEGLWQLMRQLRLQVKGTRGFRFCQLSIGGVPVTEVAPETMASRIVPGLYLCGEVLDVVGPCGGYNLQFAWTSGALAGRGATSG